MEKIKILGLIALLLVLVACGSEEESIEVNETTAPDEVEDATTQLHLIWGSTNHYVVLIDGLTGEEVARYERSSGEIISGIFNLGNGYFGLLIREASEEEIAEGFFVSTLEDDERHRYLILDESLNVIEDLVVTNEDFSYVGALFSAQPVFEGGELMVYYVFTQMQAIWYDDVQSIRRYNVHTGETEVLFEFEDEALHLDRVVRVTPELIAFRGTRLNVERAVEYGFANLTTGEFQLFDEADFHFNHSGFMSQGSHVLITEEFIPPVMGQFGGEPEVERGEVIVFNVETGVNRLIQLEGLESFWAILSLDGRYVVTIDPSHAYLRKYDVETGELAVEQAIDLEGARIEEIIAVSRGQYGVRMVTVVTPTDDESEIERYFQLITLP